MSGEDRHRVLFGRRRGRPLRPGQRLLRDELLPRLAVALPACGPFDPQTLFSPAPRASMDPFGRAGTPIGAARPIWLEIGFGSGEHLVAQAVAHPQVGFLGVEVFDNGIAKLVAEIPRHRLANIRIFADDARLLLARLPPASLARVFILFPDPWPKRRHWKRRIIAPAILDRLAMVMAEGAELRLATDDRSYLVWILQHVTAHPEFEWLARRPADWRERPPDWPPTRYEEKARTAGRAPVFLRARRRPRDG